VGYVVSMRRHRLAPPYGDTENLNVYFKATLHDNHNKYALFFSVVSMGTGRQSN
jgi:hypothetical protein